MTTPVVSGTIDWDSWTPGSIPAARQAAKLDELIATAVGRNSQWSDRASARGSLLASIEDHRLDRLAAAVADAVARGDSSDTLAKMLRGVLDDSKWADLVATTEMNRAMSAASLASYADAGLEAAEWLCAPDACEACQDNENAGPIPLGSVFPSGDDAPPAHPRCRCSVSPVVDYQSPSTVDESIDGLNGSPLLPSIPTHPTAGSTSTVDQPQTTPRVTAADLAAQGAQLRAERETAGQVPTVAPEVVDVSRPSEDDLAARIAELPAGVGGLRLGPDAGLGSLRVGRRRRKRNKAVGGDEEDSSDDDEG